MRHNMCKVDKHTVATHPVDSVTRGLTPVQTTGISKPLNKALETLCLSFCAHTVVIYLHNLPNLVQTSLRMNRNIVVNYFYY